MKRYTVLLAAILLVALAAPALCADLTKAQIVDAAVETVESGGVTLTGVDVIYDDGNTMWEERLAYLEEDTSQNHGVLPHGVLQNKTYQVVYFDYAESSPGKDIWVFVDPVAGEAFAYYEEKQ